MYSQAPKKLAGTQLDPKNICNQLPCDNYLPKTFKNVKLILFTSYHSRNANSFPLATKALVLHLDLGYAAFRQDAAASISTTIPHCAWTENTAQMEYCDENLRTFFFGGDFNTFEKYYRSKCGICPNRRGANKNVLKASRFWPTNARTLIISRCSIHCATSQAFSMVSWMSSINCSPWVPQSLPPESCQNRHFFNTKVSPNIPQNTWRLALTLAWSQQKLAGKRWSHRSCCLNTGSSVNEWLRLMARRCGLFHGHSPWHSLGETSSL